MECRCKEHQCEKVLQGLRGAFPRAQDSKVLSPLLTPLGAEGRDPKLCPNWQYEELNVKYLPSKEHYYYYYFFNLPASPLLGVNEGEHEKGHQP